MMEEMKKKLQTMHEILACSKQQADFLASAGEVDAEGLEAITTIKQNLLDTLNEVENEISGSEGSGDASTERLAEEAGQVLRQITELDAENIKKLQEKMGEVRDELQETKEKIKVNKAYQPILGKEKNVSRRLDIKDV